MSAPDLVARLMAAQNYVDSLRNPAKRAYGERYLRDVVRNGLESPSRGDLSYMGAQAVELQIRSIMNGSVTQTH